MAKITFEISDEDHEVFKWYGRALVQAGQLKSDSDYAIAKFLVLKVLKNVEGSLEAQKDAEQQGINKDSDKEGQQI